MVAATIIIVTVDRFSRVNTAFTVVTIVGVEHGCIRCARGRWFRTSITQGKYSNLNRLTSRNRANGERPGFLR